MQGNSIHQAYFIYSSIELIHQIKISRKMWKRAYPINARSRFFNAYGVTEMSVWQSLVQVTSQEDKCPIFDGSGLISDTKVHLSHTKEVIVSSDLRRCIDIESGQEMAVVGTGDLGEEREGRRIWPQNLTTVHIRTPVKWGTNKNGSVTFPRLIIFLVVEFRILV